MYSRVFKSCGLSGGRGPKSSCFRTWSIARSPLKAATMGAARVDGGAFVEILARGRAGGSFFGQAANNTGISNAIASKATRFTVPFGLLIYSFASLFARALARFMIESKALEP